MFGYKMTDYDKKIYEEELFDFLPDKIVDSHTHVSEKGQGVDYFRDYWVNKVAEEWPLDDLEQTYADLFKGKKVIPVIFGSPEANLQITNEYVKNVSIKTNYPALFCTHYNMSAEFLEKEVVSGNFQGLKPYNNNCKEGVVGGDADIYEFISEEQFKVADKYGWKVVLHISKPDRLKNESNVKTLLDIEQKYPNVKLIVAHIGRAYSPEDLGNALEVLSANSKNMMFDFCANTYSYAIEKCIDLMGAKRVLFGTDMPIAKMRMYRINENGTYINVVPRGMYGNVSNDPHMRESDEPNISNFTYEILRAFKKAATNLSLSKKDVEDIMCNNAANLYGIKF